MGPRRLNIWSTESSSTKKTYGLELLDLALKSDKDTLIFSNFWVGEPFSAWMLVQVVP